MDNEEKNLNSSYIIDTTQPSLTGAQGSTVDIFTGAGASCNYPGPSLTGNYSSITFNSQNLTGTSYYSGATGNGGYGATGNGGYGATGNGGYGATGNGWHGFIRNYDYTYQTSSLKVGGIAEFEGDIKWKGKSLSTLLEGIEKRLAILQPDPQKLEKFEALKKAYEHYKTLEAMCDLNNSEEQ